MALRLCSAIPGRQRWDVDELIQGADFAQQLERALETAPGITQARANPISRRILVLYEPGSRGGDSVQDLLQALVVRLSGTGVPRPRAIWSKDPLWRLVLLNPERRPSFIRAVGWTVLHTIFIFIPQFAFASLVATVLSNSDVVLPVVGVVTRGLPVAALGVLTLAGLGCYYLSLYFARRAWRRLGLAVALDLRSELFASILYSDVGYLESQSTGHLISRVNEDASQIGRYVEDGIPDTVELVLVVAVMGVFYVVTSPVVAAIAFVPAAAIVVVTRSQFASRQKQAYVSSQEEASQVMHQLGDALAGVSTVKSFTAEETEASHLEVLDTDAAAQADRAASLGLTYTAIVQLLMATGSSLGVAAAGVLAVEGTVSLLRFLQVVFLNNLLATKVVTLDSNVEFYRRAVAAGARVMETFERRPHVVSGDTRLPRASVRGDITFEDVYFRYPTSNPILLGINVTIPARSTAAFVGTTGAGKSTLIKLLLRFYDVQEGRVAVDGLNIRDLRLEDLRRSTGLVSQDAYLFSGSVYENIAYGRPDATDNEIVEAARAAEALEFIQRLPQGFNTVIGERGVMLSGGQRQRLAIARALLRSPAIFVFDEATSSLDSETEAAVQRSIAQVSAGHTTILIAHRLATVRRADQINVLSEGRIVERGSHEDLLRLGGIYASMWRAQTGEPLVARTLAE